ncbi:MAG TPA: hypothetical protein PKW90_17540, partial [Myxococcota bacterium]|nr:hypothetical protein [Myxococcota bacterium]
WTSVDSSDHSGSTDSTLDSSRDSTADSGLDSSRDSGSGHSADSSPDSTVDSVADSGVDSGPTYNMLPDFALEDQNPTSVRYGEVVSPRDYLTKVSGWYFLHAT